MKLVTCAPGSLILRRFCGAQWLAAPAADIRAMSVGGSRCIHCANVRRPLAPPSSCRRSPGSDTGHEALLRYPSFSARHRRRLALRHRHFNLTKQHNNLLRAKPLPRHLQAPLPAHSLTRSGPKKPSQVSGQAQSGRGTDQRAHVSSLDTEARCPRNRVLLGLGSVSI